MLNEFSGRKGQPDDSAERNAAFLRALPDAAVLREFNRLEPGDPDEDAIVAELQRRNLDF